MKERIKRKQLSFAMGILVVLAVFVGIVLIAAASYVATQALYSYGITIPYFQYAQYIIYIILGVYIVRNYITEYEYTLTDNEISVDRLIGSRKRNLLRLRLNNIISVNKKSPRIRHVQHLTIRSRKSGGVYIVYLESGKEKCAYLSPGDDFLSLIYKRTKLNDKR